ncbi:MAG TPA: hypothetical protein VFK88_00050 [Gallionella sp.]|nr:hypothetical protein [Gallionella sp.]
MLNYLKSIERSLKRSEPQRRLVLFAASFWVVLGPISAMIGGQSPLVGLVIGLIVGSVIFVFGMVPIWFGRQVVRNWKILLGEIGPTVLLLPPSDFRSLPAVVPTAPPRFSLARREAI